jgi:hypothetical protein
VLPVHDNKAAIPSKCGSNFEVEIPLNIHSTFFLECKQSFTSHITGKGTHHPQLMRAGTHHRQLMKMDFLPLNFLKREKSPPRAVLKNHSKLQKNLKMKNPIVLDSK